MNPRGPKPENQITASSAQQSRPGTVSTGDPRVATTPASSAPPRELPPSLGRYRILQEIGRGGMGAVYLADDTVLKRKVALKIPQFEPATKLLMQERFLREARMAAQLSHLNICQVYDVGIIDGHLVMAMEYVEGCNLAELSRPDRLSPRHMVTLVRKIALAVQLAHQKGMVHRDLKPANIMLVRKPDPTTKVSEPKVMDFGLAKSIAENEQRLTRTGMVVGTPRYMSKEQWSATEAQIGPAADVYSLGIILYELLTGALPFDCDDNEPPTAWFAKLLTQPVVSPAQRRPDLDPDLVAIVLRAIAREPQDRYPSMAEFADALGKWSKQSTKVAAQALHDLRLQQPNPKPGLSGVAPVGKSPAASRWLPRNYLHWLIAGGVAVVCFAILIVANYPAGKQLGNGADLAIVEKNAAERSATTNATNVPQPVAASPAVPVPPEPTALLMTESLEPPALDPIQQPSVSVPMIDLPVFPAADAEPDTNPVPAPIPITLPEIDNTAEEIARLQDNLLQHSWLYRDSLYRSGDQCKFYPNGTFHKWKWNYWVTGPREMRVHYSRSNKNKDTGILFTFNEDLSVFTSSWKDSQGRTHKITGTRQ